MMMSNNPMFLQEQDFQAKHSDLLQAAREGKAWEPVKPESSIWHAWYKTSEILDNLPFVEADSGPISLRTKLPPQAWRYISRIAEIDTTVVPDGETYGRSPGMDALPDVRTLQTDERAMPDTDAWLVEHRRQWEGAKIGSPSTAAEAFSVIERAFDKVVVDGQRVQVVRNYLPGKVHFVDRCILHQADTQTIEFSEPCNPYGG